MAPKKNPPTRRSPTPKEEAEKLHRALADKYHDRVPFNVLRRELRMVYASSKSPAEASGKLAQLAERFKRDYGKGGGKK